MKVIKLILVALVLCCTPANSQTTIHSTISGGLWGSGSTWIGGVVPGANDNVVIDGMVFTDYIAAPNTPNVCNDLLINSGGSLVPQAYGSGTATYLLYVNGNATINGNIITLNLDDRMHIFLYGDLTCNSNWTPYRTYLSGTVDRNIVLTNGSVIENPVIKESAAGKIFAGSDLKFHGDVNLGGCTVEMSNYSVVGVSPYRIHNGRIKGNFNIKGNFLVWEDQSHPLIMEGYINVIDTLQNDVYGGGSIFYKLIVEGDIINNGVIKDFNSQDDRLIINVTGNITNNNIWENTTTNFTGVSEQFITQSMGKFFKSNFADLDSLSNITANSDITIYGNFDLNRTHLVMNNKQLNISGWLRNGYLENAVLRNGFLQNLTTINPLEIKGMVTVDDGNIFHGKVIITDTLQNNVYGGGSYNYTLQCDDDITNNGVIKDNNPADDRLILKTKGHIINNSRWINYKTVFNGQTEQHITLAPGKIFDTWFEDVDSTANVKALTDIISNGSFYLGRATLDMDYHNLTLNPERTLHNGYLKNAGLKNGILFMMRLLGNTDIYGTVKIGVDVDAIGNIIVNDTLTTESNGGGTYTYLLKVAGNIENNGFVGHIYDDLLVVKVQGDIINKGIWTPYQNYMLFYPNHNANTVSCFNTGSTNWLFNGSNISGTGAAAYSITSGGGVQSITPNQSYDVTLQFNAASTDTTATLSIACSEIGSLSTVYLIGHKYQTTVDVEEENNEILPNDYVLYQNYPNPFNPSTKIVFVIPNGERNLVTLKVYDVLGKEVATLVDEYKTAGSYEVDFEASGLSVGIYYYRLQTPELSTTRKMILLK